MKRSLYRLKQTSREWNAKFCAKLLHFGFHQSVHDDCILVKTMGASFLALLVYMDGVLLTGSNDHNIQSPKDYLHGLFTIKDLGSARYFLGLEIAPSEQGIFLSQRKYILDIFVDTGLTGCKPAPTPFLQSIKLTGETYWSPLIPQFHKT